MQRRSGIRKPTSWKARKPPSLPVSLSLSLSLSLTHAAFNEYLHGRGATAEFFPVVLYVNERRKPRRIRGARTRPSPCLDLGSRYQAAERLPKQNAPETSVVIYSDRGNPDARKGGTLPSREREREREREVEDGATGTLMQPAAIRG